MKIHPGMRLKAQLEQELGIKADVRTKDYSTLLLYSAKPVPFSRLAEIHQRARAHNYAMEVAGDGYGPVVDLRFRG